MLFTQTNYAQTDLFNNGFWFDVGAGIGMIHEDKWITCSNYGGFSFDCNNGYRYIPHQWNLNINYGNFRVGNKWFLTKGEHYRFGIQANWVGLGVNTQSIYLNFGGIGLCSLFKLPKRNTGIEINFNTGPNINYNFAHHASIDMEIQNNLEFKYRISHFSIGATIRHLCRFNTGPFQTLHTESAIHSLAFLVAIGADF